jgi:hypothetical protein
MTAAVIRFPLRRVASVLVVRERGGNGWLVLAGAHGWLHGDWRSAVADAHWLGGISGFRYGWRHEGRHRWRSYFDRARVPADH